ncbi:MAG: cellulase family glycosylhydrolase [Acidobacteria bacterium]|nr:cellulase family glycosylhydrolase [Acidobacteriota bacterium]
MRRLAMIAAALGAIALAARSLVAQGSASSPPYGMVTHYVDARMADKMRELGGGIVRVDFNWITMQPSPGSRGFRFDATDATVRSARGRGLDVLATLAYAPSWANGGRPKEAPPLRLQDWDDFVSAVVERYQGRNMDVRYFGVWNEPDLRDFFRGTVSDYASLVTTARQAIKRANGSAKVLGPEVSHFGVLNGWYASAMEAVGDQFDVVTVHWYPYARQSLETYLDDAVQSRAQGKPVWLTEVGESTCERGGEDGQARVYRRVLEAFQARRSWLTSIFFYDLYEPSSKCSWPAVRSDWSNRPAFLVYKDAIAQFP